MASAFVTFNVFTADLLKAVHDLDTHTIKAYLSNDLPDAADTTRKQNGGAQTGPEEIAAGNGYTAGGVTLLNPVISSTGSTAKLVFDDPSVPTWTAGPSAMATFRYVVLYNSSASDKLIGYYDYGGPLDLASGETFTIDLDGTNGVLTLGVA